MHEPAPEQRAAIDDRSRDLFLSAAAGTGKTAVLVQRFCDAVCATEGPDADVGIENVLAFTFTEKAAGEMKARIRAELRRRGQAALAREAESAWVSTIHAFCQRLLASHPLAAGLDPAFGVLDEPAAGRLAIEAFDAAFETFAAGGEADRVELAAAFRLGDLRDVVLTAHDELRSRGATEPELPELAQPDVDAAAAELRAAAEAALAATAGATKGKAADYRERMAEALRLASERPLDDGALAACAIASTAADFAIPEVHAFNAACRLLEKRAVEAASFHHYEHLRELVRLHAREYRERKAARSALDFEDLQLAARDLLRGRRDLRERLSAQFRHVMVDEFQDTNELQLAIVELLHSPVNRLFTVGDELQSIYSFRHADVEVFRAQERRMAAAPDELAGVRRLSGNFRSRPELIALVNALGRELLPRYEDLAVGTAPATAAAEPLVELLVTEQEGWDEDGVLRGVSPDEQAQPWRVAEARFLAARLRELADAGVPRGHMVVLLRAFTHVEAYERALADEGLEPYVVGGRGYWSRQQVTDLRHLLGVVANPLDELALFGVLASPACGVLPDTLWLLRRAAGTRALWSALRRLYDPGGAELPELDEPEWAEHVPPADAERLRAFTALLPALREDAPKLGLEGLIERAIADTGYDLALLMRPAGRRRMANVRKLMRLAREFEAVEGPDLRGFLDFVDSEREIRAREGEAALQAEEHDGVRVMTVHGSKGLEFPVVAVADLGRGLGGGFPPALRLHPGGAETAEEAGAVRVGLRLARLGRKGRRIFDYDDLQRLADELTRDEERRVLHVAMTRAEQRLILSGAVKRERLAAGEPPRPLAPLYESVLPALGFDGCAGRLRVPAPPAREGLDATFDPVQVAVRVNEPAADAQVAMPMPRGAEPPDESDLAVALPHPGLAPLAAAAEGPPVRAVSYSALALYERCGYRFYAERVLGLAPELPGGPGRVDERPDPAEAADIDALVHRYARGTVVHELLERAARTGWRAPPPELVGELLRREGVPGSAPEVERVLALVGGFLSSPLCASLSGARRLSPEAPFAFRLGGLVVRGEIDLLAELDDEVVVVDYKSDRLGDADPAQGMDRYEIQRRIYALATLRRHRRPVRVAYLFLERPEAPVEARFEPADVERLGDELRALCARIERREFTVTDSPRRDLCFDCPARRRLCVHPPERTLAG